MPLKTLQEIADHVGGSIIGDSEINIESASTLDSAGAGQITNFSVFWAGHDDRKRSGPKGRSQKPRLLVEDTERLRLRQIGNMDD